MSRYYDEWRPYVSVGERRAKAKREMNKLRKKGIDIQPVEIEGRTIASSFWGKGWCSHLESFGDYENRLPRGRTYARNGSVCHLDIRKGKIEAFVSGSELYQISVDIKPLKKTTWNTLKKRCTGKIGSLIELLQGKLSGEIMQTVTDREHGLFPLPGEIHFTCNCPDWAGMCKHIAAVFYGIGARLDTKPELLFLLRGVDHQDLIAANASADAITGGSPRSRRRTLAGKDLENVFGVELDEPNDKTPTTAPKRRKTKQPKSRPKKNSVPKPHKPKSRKPAAFKPSARSVAALRRRHRMSKAEFARTVGVSAATVTNWERSAGPINPHPTGLAGLLRLHQQ